MLEGPFSACAWASDNNTDDKYSNHPTYIFGWLPNGIAYSGKGITHSGYFAILFMLAGEPVPSIGTVIYITVL